jgi:hypothetical protein
VQCPRAAFPCPTNAFRKPNPRDCRGHPSWVPAAHRHATTPKGGHKGRPYDIRHRSRDASAPEFSKFQPRDLSAEAQSAKAEARILGLRTKTERWVSVFLFATPHSPLATPINQGSGTPTDAGSVSASFDAAPPSERPSLFEGGTEGGSPVGVPPRFSPKGVVVPKARLQAKASCDSAGASGPVSSPQPGGADLAQFERA